MCVCVYMCMYVCLYTLYMYRERERLEKITVEEIHWFRSDQQVRSMEFSYCSSDMDLCFSFRIHVGEIR